MAVEDGEVSDADLCERIRGGDPRAEAELYERFNRPIRMMLKQRIRDQDRAEDLTHDTIITVLNRLRTRGIDQPEALSSFIYQTARYTMLGWVRLAANRTEYLDSVDEIATSIDEPEGSLVEERRRASVRELINEMNVERDREILYRFYVRDQPKPAICDALGLTPTNFDRVINRARARFRELLNARIGNGSAQIRYRRDR